MSEVTIQTDETPEPAKRDDAAFAAGEVVGEMRAHMSATEQKLYTLEAELRELKESAARAEATSNEAAVAAVEAQVVAAVAAVEAAEASADASVAEAEAETAPDTGPITELESPTIDVEEEGDEHEEAPAHRGRDKWSLW